jgi:hypothetical protein
MSPVDRSVKAGAMTTPGGIGEWVSLNRWNSPTDGPLKSEPSVP